MATFLDSNILIALVNRLEFHHRWCHKEVQRCLAHNPPAVVSDIVFCEASVGMKTLQDMHDLIRQWGFERLRMTDEALFLPGRAFKTYREKNKGEKTGVLPDFFVGAFASAEKEDLMSIDVRKYKTYFPEVTLVTPPKS